MIASLLRRPGQSLWPAAAAFALAACNAPPSHPTDALAPAGDQSGVRAPGALATSSAAAASPGAKEAPVGSASIDAGSTAAAAAEDAGAAAATSAGAAVADAGAAPEAGAAAFDPENRARPPLESEELQAQARALFEAIVRDEPALGDPFWFPKEPFIPLKDVKGPDKYWEQLHRTYANDIHKLHKKRRSWDGATFKRFTVGSPPKWVPPGDEANKIGYHRSFHGKLAYEIGGEAATIDVHTIISWQGRWFVTHLGKFKK